MRDGRYASPRVAFWYTPYHYMTTHAMDELYNESETEKILYEDISYGIKISIVRKYIIPRFHSCQWCHKISTPEFSLSVLRTDMCREDKEIFDGLCNELNVLMHDKTGNNAEKRRNLCKRMSEIRNRNYRWHECICEKSLKTLFIQARHYFNDWYEDDGECF